MQRMRELDAPDERRRIFKPLKVVFIIIVCVIFWLCFYHFFPGGATKRPAKTERQLQHNNSTGDSQRK